MSIVTKYSALGDRRRWPGGGVVSLFDITYETFTPESVEAGDAEERGYYAEKVTLRDAIDYISQEVPNTTDGGHWQAGDNWLTYCPGPDWMSSEHTTYSLHGKHINWIARILGAV